MPASYIKWALKRHHSQPQQMHGRATAARQIAVNSVQIVAKLNLKKKHGHVVVALKIAGSFVRNVASQNQLRKYVRSVVMKYLQVNRFRSFAPNAVKPLISKGALI